MTSNIEDIQLVPAVLRYTATVLAVSEKSISLPVDLRTNIHRSMIMITLFDSVLIGDIAAANRLVMAPLTRDRAGPGGVPSEMTAAYYRQRASAGLIITEGTQISPLGQGYLDTPGIYTADQLSGWRRVTDAVHEAGGKIVAQLWHVGRISHISLLAPNDVPVSSTDRVANAQTFTASGFIPVSKPRALSVVEIAAVVKDFRVAARNAVDAGFDGVEVHGAHGYLIEQFIRDSINDRTDIYGGSIEHRVRFVTEVMAAICGEIGAGRSGIRLSPVSPVNDAGLDSSTMATYSLVVDRMAALRIGFIHMVEGATGGARDFATVDYEALRIRFKKANDAGIWIVNNGYTREMALDAVQSGRADAVAVGRAFISNPDLVQRFKENAPLTPLNAETMYGGDDRGYTDYPLLNGEAAS